MSEKHKEALCFLLAAAGAFALWPLWHFLFHHPTPLQGPLNYYFLILLGLGVACRLLLRCTPKLIYGGALLGELTGMLYPAFDLTHACILCLPSMLLFVMPAAFGAWLASYLR
ncbi:MAG: hypothetical protein WDN72_11015 [Alphaproteobacteria bacterium]